MTSFREYANFLEFRDLEYPNNVQRRIPFTVAVFGLVLMFALFPSHARAQINGVPASVTSPGFGGRPINGTAPSVTSLGPRGFAPNAGGQFFPAAPRHDHNPDHHHHLHDAFPYYGGLYAGPAVVPYAPDVANDDNSNDDDDPNYQGGPTIFDRRGPGAEAYIPPVRDARPAHSSLGVTANSATSDPPQPPTMLVFKDGHQLEVENYAIVGGTLFDLTSGHQRRIPLAELDLDATQKMNDDRGVIFQLPPAA